MVSDDGDRIRMPTTALGAGGPVVSRFGLGLAALGRPAYITSGREGDLPDRSVASMRARTFSMLDAAYAAGIRYVDAARSYGLSEEFPLERMVRDVRGMSIGYGTTEIQRNTIAHEILEGRYVV